MELLLLVEEDLVCGCVVVGGDIVEEISDSPFGEQNASGAASVAVCSARARDVSAPGGKERASEACLSSLLTHIEVRTS